VSSYVWQDGPSGGTPITATRLNAIEDRISGQPVTLAGAGIDLTGATDCTTALRAAVAAALADGTTTFTGVPGATYKVAVTSGTALLTFAGTENVTVDLSGCTLNNSATSYTADELTPMFLLDGARNTTILLGEYIGYTLPTPATYLGYRGATLVRAINGSSGVTVDAYATNLRYGVQSGEYGDASKGQCSGFRVKLRGSMIGYPIALYYADDCEHDIDVDGVHRAVYIAGTNNVRGNVRFRDQYIADTVYLITDCLTSGTDAAAEVAPPANPTTSRGCTDVDITVVDKGSTVFTLSSALAGIGLSRVDACAFRNIKVNGYTVGTDTVSTRMGLFKVASSAKTMWTRYGFNWEPSVVIEQVEVGGTVDHSAATILGNTAGELYVFTWDTSSTHAATVRGFTVDGLTVLKSSAGSHRAMYLR